MARKLSAAQRGAIFEKLKSSSKLSTKIPQVQKPHPMISTKPPELPNSAPKNPDEVNPDYIGKGKRQRFKKLKALF